MSSRSRRRAARTARDARIRFAPLPDDLPIGELTRRAELAIDRGFNVHIKFTCPACGARLGDDQANVICVWYVCERCGERFRLRRGGFMLVKCGLTPDDWAWLSLDDRWQAAPAAA